MFDKLNIPIIGIVENMSYIKCPSCKDKINLFGNSTDRLAEELKTNILQKIPLVESINESAEKGIPAVVQNPNSEISSAYTKLAESVTNYLNKTLEIYFVQIIIQLFKQQRNKTTKELKDPVYFNKMV